VLFKAGKPDQLGAEYLKVSSSWKANTAAGRREGGWSQSHSRDLPIAY